MLRPEDFFDLSDYTHCDLFLDVEYVWDALKRLREYIESVIKPDIQGEILYAVVFYPYAQRALSLDPGHRRHMDGDRALSHRRIPVCSVFCPHS